MKKFALHKICFKICSYIKNRYALKSKGFKITYFVIVVLIFMGCSTQKNTVITRTYHNITSKYNVFFNGTESLKKGERTILENCKNDFSQLLPVFVYEDKDLVGTISSDMDRTIKKAEKLVSLHSITVKPEVKSNKPLTPNQREFMSKKEYNKWVDDDYLLMGKAQFYKHEFDKANETFLFIINEYKSEKTIVETKIWLARVYDETGDFENAKELLKSLENAANFPGGLKKLLFPTLADFQIKQNELENSIPYLQKSIQYETKKKLRVRYTYILAQIYERTGNLKKASEYYDKVIRMKPTYEMTFNATISKAMAYEKGFGQAKEIESQLLKMLKDDKNKDYKDQIYYALGNLAIKEGNTAKALERYKKSIESNTTNIDQKNKSYLTIADIYYAIPDYVNAQSYYDSAVVQMDVNYPNYDIVYAKSKNLTNLVTQLNTVQFEDSVQRLAKLDNKDLTKFIDNLIDDLRKQEEEARIADRKRQLDEQFGQELASRNSSTSNAAGGGKWYFYNETAKNLGYKEFVLKWGNRRLEDNWRRKNKTTSSVVSNSPTEDTEFVTDEEAKQSDNLSNKTREYYLRNIPVNDSMLQASHKKIDHALFNMGLIYKNDLKDPDKAADSFKELIKRYPNSENALMAYYNLYTIYKLQNNTALSELYKSKIIALFPNSNYARMLANPDYLKELEKEENKLKDYYVTTYNYYMNNNYSEVVSRCNYALSTFSLDALTPKYSYLKTLSLGRTQDTKTFRQNLFEIVSKYPGTEVAENAKDIISYLDKDKPQYKEEEEKQVALKLYEVTDSVSHYFAFVIPKGLNVNQLIFNIINFNLDNFDKLNLKIENVPLNNNQSLIVVKQFKNKDESLEYSGKITNDAGIFEDIDKQNIITFSISIANLEILKTDKSVNRYLAFYNENYR